MHFSLFEINPIGLFNQEQEHKKSEQYPFRMHHTFLVFIEYCSQRILTKCQHQICKPSQF